MSTLKRPNTHDLQKSSKRVRFAPELCRVCKDKVSASHGVCKVCQDTECCVACNFSKVAFCCYPKESIVEVKFANDAIINLCNFHANSLPCTENIAFPEWVDSIVDFEDWPTPPSMKQGQAHVQPQVICAQCNDTVNLEEEVDSFDWVKQYKCLDCQ